MDNNDVKIGRRLPLGPLQGSATGAYHRALDVARKFEATGLGDGQCLIVIHDACNTHRKVPRAACPDGQSRGTVQNTLVVMVVDSTKVHASTKDSVRGQEYESLKGTNGFAAQPA
jgi:hypothetical protein